MHFNQEHPSKTFLDNIRIGTNVFTEWFQFGRNCGHRKAINVIPSCAYPDKPILYENELWDGPSNFTIESHGLARRAIEAYTRQLNKEGAKIITCIINNSSGPHDSFDIGKTKVVGALIAKFVNAVRNEEKEVICWGTGAPKREFIYAGDVAKCLLKAYENYNNYFEPINITSGQEVTIKELAEMIADITGFTGEIVWDTSKPDGQNQKSLSMEKMKQYIDVEFTPMKIWLKETIDWYADNYN